MGIEKTDSRWLEFGLNHPRHGRTARSSQGSAEDDAAKLVTLPVSTPAPLAAIA
jgi:hypothetical protein